ncbi:luc7-like protein 3 isoform X2 [Ruditapes philippinarum]|uniref:luc7-like protein 3 isoform X2 n=1 Tax=Ruditapes philippinarum TaxID=129788 RepID=UPI00295AF309|nr:luc7-like protein 3 isoform X2 [Ruditapes philippinarum]
MASNALAAMLDELMGRDRNLAPTEKRSEPKWDDPEVCRYYLVDFCPHELFTNTRADLGQCEKIHDDHLRKEYKKSSRVGRLGYEEDFLRYLQTLINDVEKRIRRGHQRLALNSMQGNLNGNPASQKEEKVKMLTERINELVQKAEELGCEGKVEEAQGIMKLCDQLNEERTQLQNNPTPDPYNEPLKAMEVCTVCGALLVVGDAQQRVDEHIMGKQHSGYARIRAYVEGKRMKTKEEEEEKEAKLKQEREEREKEREKEREERRKKDEERKKEREEREKERERRKKRSRSRSKSRRSRSRDRKKRSRSRSRHRRRSRSRSRDRHHKSRRHRSRSRDRSSRSEDKKRRSRSREKSSKKSSRERSRSEDKQKEPTRSKSKEKTDRPSDDGDKAIKVEVKQENIPEQETENENQASDMEPGETN